jgi:hypothetical protein
MGTCGGSHDLSGIYSAWGCWAGIKAKGHVLHTSFSTQPIDSERLIPQRSISSMASIDDVESCLRTGRQPSPCPMCERKSRPISPGWREGSAYPNPTLN